MPKIIIMGRPWDWWLLYNSHQCYFCKQGLGSQTGLAQPDEGYWQKLYYVWLKHIKSEHPELLTPNPEI